MTEQQTDWLTERQTDWLIVSYQVMDPYVEWLAPPINDVSKCLTYLYCSNLLFASDSYTVNCIPILWLVRKKLRYSDILLCKKNYEKNTQIIYD